MTDVAAQREARRLKLMKNAESRLNRLKGTGESAPEDTDDSKTEEIIKDSTVIEEGTNLSDNKKDDQNYEPTSPYNLRHRPNRGSPELPAESSHPVPEKKTSTTPYEIVDDPEVPSLAEFLATREASKVPGGKNRNLRTLPPKTLKQNFFPEKRLEQIKVAGIFFTALLSRWFLGYNTFEGIFFFEVLFQSMFFPFLLFEVSLYYILHSFLKVAISSPPSGSLLTTALMLCGVRAELVQVYIKIMGHVTSLSNDFFLYIFAFLVCHVAIGS